MHRVLALGVVLAGLLAALPASRAAESQHGQLRIVHNGENVGTETYEITATATELQARGEIVYVVNQQKTRQTTSLLLGADALPRRYEWKLEEPRKSWLRMEFEAGKGTIWFPDQQGREEQQVFDFGRGPVALLDINVFHHFLLLARLYDVARGGPQTIQVFVPQSVQPGAVTMELQGVETLAVEASPQPVRHFSILSEDNRLELWVTEAGRFVRLRVPQANVEVLPEGSAP